MKLLQRLFASVAALHRPRLRLPQARAPQARPALWAVSDADTTIYLFGTIHLLPDNYQWRTPKLDQAVGGSQQLVVETIVDDKNPTKLMQAMSSLAFSPGLPPLAQRVPPEKRAALAEAVKQERLSAPGLRPHGNLGRGVHAARQPVQGSGAEGQRKASKRSAQRLSRARASRSANWKAIFEQLSFFDKLPEKAQRDLLEGAIEQSDARPATTSTRC